MKLVFVYNVNSDPLSLILDGAHKVFSPSTYACELCEITYSNLGERRAWKKFRKSTQIELEFIYKNQMIKRYGIDETCPLVLFVEDDRSPEIRITKQDFSTIKTPEELIILIENKLANG